MSIKEILAPANILSFSRIPLAVWIVTLLPSYSSPSAALPSEALSSELLSSEMLSSMRLAVLLLAIAGLTDYLDGILARLAEQSSGRKNPYGIVFDPITDKIFAIVLIIGLIAHNMFPLWLAVIILGRDLIIMGAGALLARKYHLVLPSNLPGKYYFAALAFLLAAYLAKFEMAIAFLEPLTVALWFVSGWFYVRVFKTTLAQEQQQQQQPERTKSLTGARLRTVAIVLFFIVLIAMFALENPLLLW
jgi:phosphatidylglycerophosphate synthase